VDFLTGVKGDVHLLTKKNQRRICVFFLKAQICEKKKKTCSKCRIGTVPKKNQTKHLVCFRLQTNLQRTTKHD
jgi:hypothetical protein